MSRIELEDLEISLNMGGGIACETTLVLPSNDAPQMKPRVI